MALLVAVALVAGGLLELLLPVGMAKAAANISTWAELKTAIEDINNNETEFVLTANLTADSTITIPAGKDITIKSDAELRTIARGSIKQSIIQFDANIKCELTLESIVLDGEAKQDFIEPLILINGAGILNMENGSVIQNNHANGEGGAVYIENSGVLNMGNGSLIQKNTANYGAGVFVDDSGTFNMGTGSVIKDNTSFLRGGGVSANKGTFNMTEGSLIQNNKGKYGGGADVYQAAFNMNGGEISNNEAEYGGGVYQRGRSAIMKGGKITGNTATGDGNGVYIYWNGTFTMEGGSIDNGDSAVFVDDNANCLLILKNAPIISGVYVDKALAAGITIGDKITGGSVVVAGSKPGDEMVAGKTIASMTAANFDATAAGIFKNADESLVGTLSEDKSIIIWKDRLDLTELNKAIGIAEGLAESNYTATSWAGLAASLNNAKTARTAKTQDDVNAATKALNDAINNLQRRPSQPNPPITDPNPSPTETDPVSPTPTETTPTPPKPTPTPEIVITPDPSIPQDKPTAGWNQPESTPPRYITQDGAPATGWQQLTPPGGGDPVWYYFDDNGYAVSGWLKEGKNADGTDRWYFLYPAEGGTAKTPAYSLAVGWHRLHWKGSDNWYYFHPNGAMHIGWLQQGKNADGTDRWYYLKPFRLGDQPMGSMATGWVKIMYQGVPTWFYFAESGTDIGIMQTGWVYWNGHWYYLDKDGAMVTGWKQIFHNGKLCRFYFEPGTDAAQPQGSMYTGPYTIAGKKYSFSQNGVLE